MRILGDVGKSGSGRQRSTKGNNRTGVQSNCQNGCRSTGIHVIYHPTCDRHTSVQNDNQQATERAESKSSPTVTMLTPHTRAPTSPTTVVSGAWNCADWGRIVFSDESSFLLCPDDRCKRVWRRPGQRVDPSLTVEHHTGPQQGVMVWNGISFDSRTPLVVIPGTLTAQRLTPLTDTGCAIRPPESQEAQGQDPQMNRISLAYNLTIVALLSNSTPISTVSMPPQKIRAHYEHMSEFETGRANGLKEAGWSNRLIARHLCQSDAAIRRCWQKWVNNESMQCQDSSGRPRATTEREDRAIVRMAVAAPESTLSTLQRVTGTQVSKMTINRRLRALNLRARRPLRCLPLTPVHRQVRLQWCRKRSTWNCADWGRIVFSDKSCFLLCPDDHRKRVWRRPGQRVDPGLTVEHHTGPQQGVMVWGAISFDSRTPLVVIPGTLTAQRYVDEILRPVLLPFLSHHLGLTFQQDNARPHTAHFIMDCL
ncbi:hypothetical protein LAZ67_X001927 [Cordylochernes scorpioides]|uniref:Transposase Tc1-like domain-containing protein n=1 Tax=Cordylochernes scorpioides TaxID=51811 RepID=A0ABY6LSZ0_9ARAC|nr:hypothetical protein LAZ67_X001927 [Cordylochernes scorpioides]